MPKSAQFAPVQTPAPFATPQARANGKLDPGWIDADIAVDASVTPAPNKIPRARPNGKLHPGWINFPVGYQSPLTTRGDLLTRNFDSHVRLPIGAAGTFLRSDGTDPSWQELTLDDLPEQFDILGTENQVIVTDGEGRVLFGDTTFSLPQDIHTEATPEFNALSLLDGERTENRPLLDATQTWNEASTAFQAIRVDVTDDGSDFGDSAFIEYIRNGQVAFKVYKTGELLIQSQNSTESFLPLVQVTQTWDAALAFYEGIRFDLTDNGASASSRMISFRRNFSEVFAIRSNGSLVLADNVRQVFNPGATVAGLNVGEHTADPSTLLDGDLWYDSVLDKYRGRQNSVTVSFATLPVDLTTDVTGTLPVGSGGTGVTGLSDILGTINQVSVAGGTARVIGGNVTLSLPQDIHTAADPTFNQLTLTSRLQMQEAEVIDWTNSVGTDNVWIGGNDLGDLLLNATIGGTVRVDADLLEATGSIASPSAAFSLSLETAQFSTYASSPAQITSDQNNYATTDNTFFRLSTDATRTITGLANGVNGKHLILANVGGNNLVLANESGLSSANNRIITGTGADLVVGSGEQVFLIYDITDNRWRCGMKSFSGGAGPHALLSSEHSDTLAATVSRGSLIVGNSTPAWSELVIGAANRVLRSDGTDASWAQVNLALDVTGDLPYANLTPASTDSVLLGRGDSGAGDWEEITLGSGLAMTGSTLSATGSGTPGGADTQVQFNDGGSFGGVADFTFGDGGSISGNGLLQLTGELYVSGGANDFALFVQGTHTLNANMGGLFSLSPTWNGLGTYTGLDIDVTDNASASTSNFLRCRIGATEKFSIQKDGELKFVDGVRQTFNPDGTKAGINVGSVAGDPSSPSNGDMWYNTSTNKMRVYENGAARDM